MSGEKNLQTLLKTMKPILNDSEFVFCSIKTSELKSLNVEPICIFREQEGITLILTRENAEKNHLHYSFMSRMITLTVHSSLEAVGFLAIILNKLAENGISVNTISAYYHDHLFVPTDKADHAMKVLQNLTQEKQ